MMIADSEFTINWSDESQRQLVGFNSIEITASQGLEQLAPKINKLHGDLEMKSTCDRILRLSLFSLLCWNFAAIKVQAVDMFLSSTGNNTIYRLKDDGSYTVFNNTIATPTGITYGDNTFFVNSGGTKIVTLTWNGVVNDFITTGISNPSGITYGPDGYLYIADSGTNSILRADSTGTVTTFASNFNNPKSIVFDAQANMYVTNNTVLGSITKITPSGVRTTLTSGLSNPYGLAYGNDNNLYVSTQGNSGVYTVNLSGTATLKGLGISNPTAVYRSTAGDVRVASESTGVIYTVFSPAQINPFASGFASPSFITVPEPSTYLLSGVAVLLLGCARWRKK
jgi:hypothetical protein